MDDATRRRIVQLRNGGWTQAKIAAALGLSRVTVHRTLDPGYAARQREVGRKWRAANKARKAETDRRYRLRRLAGEDTRPKPRSVPPFYRFLDDLRKRSGL